MANEKTAITYLRVSTARQGSSGLGLDAQRDAVIAFTTARRINLIAEYVEVESGKKDDRPQLAAALHHARKIGAVLVIAKLDRLARRVSFLSALMESGTDFIAVDMPDANKFVLHIMAAVAEFEREQISNRTKAALAAAKARGIILGVHSQVLAKKRIAEAQSFAEFVRNLEGDIFSDASLSVREVARRLNARGVRSPSGSLWSAGNTGRLLERLRSSDRPSGQPRGSH
ncbi:recombinase family protein [Pseudomonas sp. ODNR1LW]|nr:recombinase family protein [Pseudomonas sp. ODNR1LW]